MERGRRLVFLVPVGDGRQPPADGLDLGRPIYFFKHAPFIAAVFRCANNPDSDPSEYPETASARLNVHKFPFRDVAPASPPHSGDCEAVGLIGRKLTA